MDLYYGHFQKIESSVESIQKNIETRLRKRFETFSQELNVDEPRFLQEVVYYMEKLDISEEINRIHTHFDRLSELIEKGGEVGRQIEFLLQELNRETNTIGSKSSMEDISESVVQMKVQLEKMREQALNLE